MTGSSLAPVIIPIVVSICLAAWLIMVYYASSHPQWKSARPAPGEASPPLSQASPAPGHQTAGTAGRASGRARSGRPVAGGYGSRA